MSNSAKSKTRIKSKDKTRVEAMDKMWIEVSPTVTTCDLNTGTISYDTNTDEVNITVPEPEAVKVLRECIELQLRKSRDYQNPNSRVKQADYYPSGVKTIHEICQAKMLRALSVMEAMENDPSYTQNFESLEDSFKDLINYASFAVSYCRKQIPGQNPGNDAFNRKVENNA